MNEQTKNLTYYYSSDKLNRCYFWIEKTRITDKKAWN